MKSLPPAYQDCYYAIYFSLHEHLRQDSFFLRFDISTFISHVLTFYLFKHLYTENGSEWGVKRSRVDWAFTKTGQALNHSKQKNITK